MRCKPVSWGTSANALPSILQRRRERVVVGQLPFLGELLDDKMVLGNGESLVDQDGFERIVVDSAACGLLILEREGLDAFDEVTHVLAVDLELADPDKEETGCGGFFGHLCGKKSRRLLRGLLLHRREAEETDEDGVQNRRCYALAVIAWLPYLTA